jgi:hypothetical protein
LPDGIRIKSVDLPKMNFSEISYANFEYRFNYSFFALKILEVFLQKNNAFIAKKTKSRTELIDLKKYIRKPKVTLENHSLVLSMFLPAGNTFSINPLLVIDAINDDLDIEFQSEICRVMLCDSKMEIFE